MNFQIIYLAIVAPFILFILLFFILQILSLQKIFSKNFIGAICAGLLISLTFINFLPKSLENNTSFAFSITAIITLISLLLIETHLIPKMNIFFNMKNKTAMDCSHHHHHPFSHQVSFSAIGCLLICSFFDGIRLASALFINIPVTGVFAVASIFHILPEGIAVMALAKKSELTLHQCYLVQILFCLFLGLGILVTGLMNLTLSPNIILSLSTATLLYVSFVHLLPVAFTKENQKWFIASLILSATGLFLIH